MGKNTGTAPSIPQGGSWKQFTKKQFIIICLVFGVGKNLLLENGQPLEPIERIEPFELLSHSQSYEAFPSKVYKPSTRMM